MVKQGSSGSFVVRLWKGWGRHLVWVGLLVVCAALLGARQQVQRPSHSAATLVYLVRHAEKAKDGTSNPPLTVTGHKRAKALARMLRAVPLDAVYATQYKRTQQTVAPTAKAKGLALKIIKAHKEHKLLRALKGPYKGKSVLIAGHSNTIPKMIKALGGPQTIKLKERTDYDDVFVLILHKQAPVTFLRFHVGPKPPK